MARFGSQIRRAYQGLHEVPESRGKRPGRAAGGTRALVARPVAIGAMMCAAVPGHSAEASHLQFEKVAIVAAHPDRVFRLLGDFASIASWIRSRPNSKMEGNLGAGYYRTLSYPDGRINRELLTAYSLRDRMVEYELTTNPGPWAAMFRTRSVRMTIAPEGAGHSRLHWRISAQLNPGVATSEAAGRLDTIYESITSDAGRALGASVRFQQR